jgi:hypothetical protein
MGPGDTVLVTTPAGFTWPEGTRGPGPETKATIESMNPEQMLAIVFWFEASGPCREHVPIEWLKPAAAIACNKCGRTGIGLRPGPCNFNGLCEGTIK